MPPIYDGAVQLMAGQVFDGGVAVAVYDGDELILGREAGFVLNSFRISGTTHMKMRVTAGLTAHGNGQINLWRSGTDAVGSIEEGDAEITGITGVDMDLSRIAKWDDAQDRFILNADVTTGIFNTGVLAAGRQVSIVFADETVFTLGAYRAGGNNWADWWVSSGQITQDMFDKLNAVAAGDQMMIAIHTGAASYSVAEPMPEGPVLSDWSAPAGKVAVSGPAQIVAASGVGTGGYAKGLWMRTIGDTAGFGELEAGDLPFTAGGISDVMDDIKFRDDSGQARFAVSRFPDPDDVANDANLSTWLTAQSTGIAFVIQTANRTMQLPWTAATDRSAGPNWVSWWLTGSGRANSMLTAEDITELNRVRDAGDRFLAAWVVNT